MSIIRSEQGIQYSPDQTNDTGLKNEELGENIQALPEEVANPDKKNKSGLLVKAGAGLTFAALALVGGTTLINRSGSDENSEDHFQDISITNPSIEESIQVESPAKNTEPVQEKLEIPKTVTWSAEMIADAQNIALENDKVLFANTWNKEGGESIDVENFRGLPFLALEFKENAEGKVFKSPISGKVTGVGITELQNGKIMRTLFVKVGNIEVEFLVDDKSKIEVKNGEVISVGAPIITLSGNLVPPEGRFSKPSHVVMGDVTKFSSTAKDILRDDAGVEVALQSPDE